MRRSIIMKSAGHVARIGKRSCVCRVLVGKSKGKKPIGRPGRRCEDNKKDGSSGTRVEGAWTRSIRPRIGTDDGFL